MPAVVVGLGLAAGASAILLCVAVTTWRNHEEVRGVKEELRLIEEQHHELEAELRNLPPSMPSASPGGVLSDPKIGDYDVPWDQPRVQERNLRLPPQPPDTSRSDPQSRPPCECVLGDPLCACP
jgi:hypothetical protein